MIEEKLKQVKKLSEVQILYFQVYCCLYSRENKIFIENLLKEFEENFEYILKEKDLLSTEYQNYKEVITKEYEAIIIDFFNAVETLFYIAISRMLEIETEQNVIRLKKFFLESIQQRLNDATNKENLENIINAVKKENISIETLDSKLKKYINKLDSLEFNLKICNDTFEKAYLLRKKGIKIIKQNKFCFEIDSNNNFFNRKKVVFEKIREKYKQYFENFKNVVNEKMNDNVFELIDTFDDNF